LLLFEQTAFDLAASKAFQFGPCKVYHSTNVIIDESATLHTWSQPFLTQTAFAELWSDELH
jgi:hypothetical protein